MLNLNSVVYGQEKAESKMPDRKAGEKVPIGFLIEGNEEYYSTPEWIQKG
ncbi:hypothetical protein P7H21_25385 [Paenibacillus larvae]|nr:hypothetical protein [Paenibacillus larvae]MDT2306621.1 hypothetical protein [Paenibacillus larvae]